MALLPSPCEYHRSLRQLRAPSVCQGPRTGATSPAVLSDGAGTPSAREAGRGAGSGAGVPHPPGPGGRRGVPAAVMAGGAGRAAAAPGVSAGVRQRRGAGRPPGEMISGAGQQDRAKPEVSGGVP